MKMFTIEVDEEVYRFIESEAVPFVDKDPNSVLRKLLLKKGINVPNNVRNVTIFSDLGMPDGLRQVLQVVDLVKQGEDRVGATKKVALAHGIKYPTVVDKYARQLGKRVLEINKMLQEPEFHELKALLKKKYGAHSDTIEEFFGKP